MLVDPWWSSRSIHGQGLMVVDLALELHRRAKVGEAAGLAIGDDV